MHPIFCNASVDFKVPGMPSPWPVKLIATVCTQSRYLPTGILEKNVIEFTDPSGVLASPSVPLNTWVQLENVAAPGSCMEGSPLVFKDIHDGDSKLVTLSGNRLSIAAFGNDERLSTFLRVIQSVDAIILVLSFEFLTHKHLVEVRSFHRPLV